MKDKIQLLSTVLLDQPFVNEAEEKGIALDSMAFIRVDMINEAMLLKETEEICSLPIIAVFTSANAVRALSKLIYITKPDWNIYCIGNATKIALLDYFHVSAIKGCANDAAALAEIIFRDDIGEVFFFCGDQRMDTLPDTLREHEILVHEMIVYQTIETPQVVNKEYDGILFFSPSAVNSFFSVNTISANTVLFAIGKTTANALDKKVANKVIVSETPSKEHVVSQAIGYFYKDAPITTQTKEKQINE